MPWLVIMSDRQPPTEIPTLIIYQETKSLERQRGYNRKQDINQLQSKKTSNGSFQKFLLKITHPRMGKWLMYSVNIDGETLLQFLRLVGVSQACLLCHQQKFGKTVNVGNGGTRARIQTSGPLCSSPNGFHTTALCNEF